MPRKKKRSISKSPAPADATAHVHAQGIESEALAVLREQLSELKRQASDSKRDREADRLRDEMKTLRLEQLVSCNWFCSPIILSQTVEFICSQTSDAQSYLAVCIVRLNTARRRVLRVRLIQGPDRGGGNERRLGIVFYK